VSDAEYSKELLTSSFWMTAVYNYEIRYLRARFSVDRDYIFELNSSIVAYVMGGGPFAIGL
jgi:hypothetical protein